MSPTNTPLRNGIPPPGDTTANAPPRNVKPVISLLGDTSANQQAANQQAAGPAATGTPGSVNALQLNSIIMAIAAMQSKLDSSAAKFEALQSASASAAINQSASALAATNQTLPSISNANPVASQSTGTPPAVATPPPPANFNLPAAPPFVNKLEFEMALPWTGEEHLRLLEAAKLFLGSDFSNLASQSAGAGLSTPATSAWYTTPEGFRKLKDLMLKHRSFQHSRLLENGDLGHASSLAAAPAFPLVAALARAPIATWKKDQLAEYLISVLGQALTVILHSNAGLAIPILLQTLQLLKVIEFDSALGHFSWPFLVPIFEQLAKDSVHRPSTWTTALASQIQEARHSYHLSAKSSSHQPQKDRERDMSPGPGRLRASSPPPRVRIAEHPGPDRNGPRANNSHRPFCVNWNDNRPCASTNCSFNHSCSICKGSHRSFQCRSDSHGPRVLVAPAQRR